MEESQISVIIPSYRRPCDLRRCLTALSQQTRLADEVCVVVRDNDKDTSALIRDIVPLLRGLREIRVTKPGLVAAMNQGLHCATRDILVFTDDDAEPTPQWIEGIRNWYLNDPKIGAVGGRDCIQLEASQLRDPAPTTDIGQLGRFGRISGNHHCPCPVRPLEVTLLKGVNMSFRRAALQNRQIDERLRGPSVQMGTEIDLCWPLKKLGWRIIFDDRLMVKHHIAPRRPGDDRLDFAGAVGRDFVFNNFYLMGKYGAPFQVAGSMFHRIFIGSRWTPGILALCKWCFKGDWHVISRFNNQFSGIFRGTINGFSQRKKTADIT